jgi:prolyl 4-hydroxylase
MTTVSPGGGLDERWVGWLREWMRRGGDMTRPVEELRKLGFHDRAILAAIESARPRGNALAGGAMRSLPLMRRAPSTLRRLDAPFPIYTLEEFLTRGECAGLLDSIGGHLKPSPLPTALNDKDFRTSTTANLYEIDDLRSDDLEEKISRTLGIHAPYGEGIQAQRYDVGQQYKPHYDCFLPGSPVWQRFASLRGNRTWTFMVYLNDDFDGGATRFVHANIVVKPRAGMALLWDNLLESGEPNPATLHCGEPVIRGFKVVITHWYRVQGDGPVLRELTASAS